LGNIKSKKSLTIILFFIGLIITFFVFVFFLIHRVNLINLLSIFGTYASIFGIGVGIIHLISVNENIKLTNFAIIETIDKIDNIVTISELSSATNLIEEIQAYLLSEKYEMSLTRLKDLKKVIIENSYKYNELNNLIPFITLDVNNLAKLVDGAKGIKVLIIRENLENISTTLTKIKVTLNPLYNDNR